MSRLGSHPDKDIIVKLTTMAMHQQNRARDIVDLIQSAVLNVSDNDNNDMLVIRKR